MTISEETRKSVSDGRRRMSRKSTMVVGMVFALLVFTFFSIRGQLEAYAATTATGSFVGLAGKCLDNANAKAVNKNRIMLYKCNGTKAQKWVLSGNGALRANAGSNYCLDVPGNSKAEYAYVQLYRCNGTGAQAFALKNNTIVSKTTGYCVTVHYGETVDRTRLWMKACHAGTKSQQWKYSGSIGSVTPGPTTPTEKPSPSNGGGTGNAGGSPATGNSGIKYGTPEHPFAANSPWNTPIPSNPKMDANSPAIVANVLNNKNLVLNMILYSYGQPVYTATASTPKVTFGGRGGSLTIPWDSSWSANVGSDAKVNVIDPATQTEYELQGFDAKAKTIYWWVKHNYVTGLADGFPTNGERKGPTGSAMSQFAGMVRISDIKSGSIEHALSFITSNPQQGVSRYPASQTDGTRTAPNGIAEGMRIQLDPGVNLDSLGLTAGEKMIAKALQKYGAYNTDTGQNNNMAAGFYAEKPTTTADPYPGVGWSQDWAVLKKIPRDKLRVLDASVTQRP